MINAIWLVMILSGILAAGLNGNPEVITDAAFQASKAAVKYSLELIGIMAFWLGIMRIAEEAGIVRLLAWLLRPLTKLLFPSIPDGHPAMGTILMNISANILGMGNAATPFGLKAMEELQSLNPAKEQASEAMCTFLALNTACITLLPTTIIGLRLSADSANPTEIIGPTLCATGIGMTVAICCDRVFRFLYRGRER
jgi:spore maturation protein A